MCYSPFAVPLDHEGTKSMIITQRLFKEKHTKNALGVKFAETLLLLISVAMVQLSSGSAMAFEAGAVWGTTDSSSGPAGFAQSSVLHTNNGTAALYADQGRDAMLPGSTITTIGVFNQLSVMGDGNNLSTDQTGTNSGAVTSDTDLTYQRQAAPLEQTLFPAH